MTKFYFLRNIYILTIIGLICSNEKIYADNLKLENDKNLKTYLNNMLASNYTDQNIQLSINKHRFEIGENICLNAYISGFQGFYTYVWYIKENYSNEYTKISNFDELNCTINNLQEGIYSFKFDVEYRYISNSGFDIGVKNSEIKNIIVGNPKIYKDVENHWAKDSINFVISKDLFKGTSEYEFSPDIEMTKGMFLLLLSRVKQNPKYEVTYDVNYDNAVLWGIENNILDIENLNKFMPHENITREELALFLDNYINAMDLKIKINEKKNLKLFNDINNIKHKDSIIRLQEYEILTGDLYNNFNPYNTATRAEIAVVINRFMEKF